MRPALLPLLLLIGSAVGCGDRLIGGEESGENQEAPLVTADWSPCVVKDEFETCAEVCAAQGSSCAALGCPAQEMSCKPQPCDMATSALGLGDAVCSDISTAAYVAGACDDPIEFITTNTARCCCED